LAPEWLDEFAKLQDKAPAWTGLRSNRNSLTEIWAAPERFSTCRVMSRWQPPRWPRSIVPAGRRKQGRAQGSEAGHSSRDRGRSEAAQAPGRDHRVRSARSEAVPSAPLVRQFAQSLRKELDFAAECRNAERIAEALDARLLHRHSRHSLGLDGERLNVQDYIDGNLRDAIWTARRQPGWTAPNCPARDPGDPEDDPGRGLLPCRSAPGQRQVPAGPPHRDCWTSAWSGASRQSAATRCRVAAWGWSTRCRSGRPHPGRMECRQRGLTRIDLRVDVGQFIDQYHGVALEAARCVGHDR
jgi:hypothetical protein